MINTDLSGNTRWVARRECENSFTLTFTSSGAFNISSYTFVLNIRRIGDDTNTLQLTQGSGITNWGASGILTVLLSEANSDLLLKEEYYYELIYTLSGNLYTLFNGVLQFYKQANMESDPEPEFTSTVRLGSNLVTLSFAA